MSNPMLDAKTHRKRAEVDLQLISNRIALLRSEEEKALQKVEVTKERAKEILEIKTRNEMDGNMRQTNRMQREQNVKLRRERAQREREDRKKRLEISKKMLMDTKVAIAMEKKQHAERLLDERARNEIMAEIEKRQRAEKQRKREEVIRKQREKERLEAEKKIQEEYQERLMEESRRAEEADKLIQKLEAEERKLLQKLRNTRELQEDAYSKLRSSLEA
jgi:hypothetical protein